MCVCVCTFLVLSFSSLFLCSLYCVLVGLFVFSCLFLNERKRMKGYEFGWVGRSEDPGEVRGRKSRSEQCGDILFVL